MANVFSHVSNIDCYIVVLTLSDSSDSLLVFLVSVLDVPWYNLCSQVMMSHCTVCEYNALFMMS